MSIFQYAFGYTWPWTWGHALAAVAFGLLALLVWQTSRARWQLVVTGALTLWAISGAVITHAALRFSLPLELPTERFLAEGRGRVLDVGAGSGRSTLMVLLERPQATVVALDRFTDGYGIGGNTPDRLRANAAAGGVAGRLEVQIADMREMPLENASFDAAVSAYAIDHLRTDDVARTLGEVNRILRGRGEFLLMVINPDAWIRVALPMLAEHGYFGRRPMPDLWRQRLESAGFEILEVGRVPGTLYVLASKR